MISHRYKILERHNFFPAILLWIAVAGKAWIAHHWVTEKKSNMALTNQWRSFWQAQKRGKQSFLQSSSKRKRGFTPKLRVEVRGPRGLEGTTIFPRSQPPWQGDRKPEWSAQTEPPKVTKAPSSKPASTFGSNACAVLGYHWKLHRIFKDSRILPRSLRILQGSSRYMQRPLRILQDLYENLEDLGKNLEYLWGFLIKILKNLH